MLHIEPAAGTREPRESPVCSVESHNRVTEALQTRLCVAHLQHMQRTGAFPKTFSRPLGFQLELTSACNLACKHCYNQSGVVNTSDLPNSLWERVVDEIAEMRPFQVILSGGEPLLLGDRLLGLMDRLYQDPTRFVLITNGWLATPKRLRRLFEYSYYWIQVSIDGFSPEAHDSFRGLTGSWKRAVRAAYCISASGKPLVIAHTVHPRNIDTLPEMIDLALMLGASRIICDEAMAVGRAYGSRNEIMLTDAQRERMAQVILSKHQEYQNTMEVLRTSDPANSFELYRTSPCSVLLIRPNGDVKLDCVLPYVIGNVRDQSIAEIWEKTGKEAWMHPRVQAFVDAYRAAGDFANCEARPYVDDDILLRLAP